VDGTPKAAVETTAIPGTCSRRLPESSATIFPTLFLSLFPLAALARERNGSFPSVPNLLA
jgi:hypothetical protein